MVASNHNRESRYASIGTDAAHYVACRVRQFLTLDALGTRDRDYFDQLLRRQVEFLSCLIRSGDDRCTYDLRFISHPDPEVYTRGRIVLALICRLENTSIHEADSFAEHIFQLLQALFEEYDVELVPKAELVALLEPFDVRCMASISRRCGWNSLETMTGHVKTMQPLGFAALARDLSVAPEFGRVFHLFPFLPSSAPHNNLFNLLLLQANPLMLSCRFRPTTLQLEEEKFLEEQIFRCERYAQVGLGQAPDDISNLRPTLQRHARIQQQFMTRMLHSLKDRAALLRIEIGSPCTIHQAVVDMFGHLVSRPAGMGPHGATDDLEEYFSGGYEVRRCNSETVQASTCLQIPLEDPPGIPPGMERLPHLFGASEAAAAFRFPSPTADPLPGVDTRRWRYVTPPSQVPLKGLRLAKSRVGGTWQEIKISPEDRGRHVYIVGQTGTGKTTMLRSMIESDIEGGNGICVIDPHGDLFRWVLSRIPDDRLEDVVIIDPADTDFPVGLNMLDCEGELQRHMIVHDMVGIIMKIMEDEYGDAAGQMMGPVFFQHVRMNLLLVMSNPDAAGTLLDFYKIFVDSDYWKRWVPLKIRDPQLETWAKQVLPRIDYFKNSDGVPFGGYITSKFEEFVFDPMLRNIFGQSSSTIHLQEIMDTGKILLVNLAKGELSDVASRFLGMVLLARLQAASMCRVKIPLEARRPFFIYVDEFQNIATQSFITMLSESRKFGLGLVLANQFVGQLKDRRITESIFGNIGTLVCFRVGQSDAETLEKFVAPGFSRSDLTSLPNWYSIIGTLVNGQTVQPFTIETSLGDTTYKQARADLARAESRRRYSRPRAMVERELGYA